MTLHGPSDSSGRLAQGTQIHVDASYGGTTPNGSPEQPYTTIQDGIDAGSAGDEVLIRSGAYTEDLVLADAINLMGIGEGLVTVTGTCTATDVGCTIEGIAFTDDGAGNVLYFTGTAVETLYLRDCMLTSTATGDMALAMDNTAGTVDAKRCVLLATTGNANEVLQCEQGTLTMEDCQVTHADNTSESIVYEGDAATTSTLIECELQGLLASETTAANPIVTLTRCSLTVGAVSCADIAAGNTLTMTECVLDSADAGNAAVDGAGTLEWAQCSFRGTATAPAATLTVVNPVSTSETLHMVNIWYVDASYAGGESFGSELHPYATIQAAITAANAGDLVKIAPGAYTEDLTLADGVDLVGMSGPVANDVVITGECVGTDGSYSLTNLSFIDDGADRTMHLTGTGAEAVTLSGCILTSTATGDAALECDNTNLTLTALGCRFVTQGANANQTVLIESGTHDFTACDFTHATNTNECFVAEGDAATTITARQCRFTGNVGSEAAAVNPAMNLADCQFTVGAVSCLVIAAGNTVFLKDAVMTSTDAANDAVDGAGTLTLITPISFLSTADEIPATITLTHSLDSRIQSGTVAAAGASPQTDTVTLPQPYPDTNYQILLTSETTGGAADDTICSVDEGTIAAGTFDVITTNAAAGAVACNVHWLVIHD
jgi:hypothetical protein